jgi:lantibiotic biosynthesis protein
MTQAGAEVLRACEDAGRHLLTTVVPGNGGAGETERRWLPQSLSTGAAGIALAHAVHGHAEQADRWLAAAVAGGVTVGAGSGLWFGAPAVAFTAASTTPDRYRTALTHLDHAVARLIRVRLDAAAARMSARARPALSEFDLVKGLTGLGAYLLIRDPDGPLLRAILSYLVQLTEPVPADDEAGTDVPGWWTGGAPSVHSPIRGHANFGMAHGITGPLALLSLAARQGITTAGHITAIDRITGWLDSWQQQHPRGVWWPKYVSLADVHAGRPSQMAPGRPSWCYGTPGISRALQLAAIARGNPARQRAAEQALLACVNDPAQLAELIDPYLCHGWAGVAATVRSAATDALTTDLASALPRLTAALLDTTWTAGQPPGLISGHAGVGLVMHAVAHETTPAWLTCLLIS